MTSDPGRGHLVVALHGYAGTGTEMAQVLVRSTAFRSDMSVHAPDGSHDAPLVGSGHAWFPLTSVRAALGERARAASAPVLDVVTALQRRHAVTRERTTLVGFSQGATLVAALLERPDPPFERAVLVCGRLPERAAGHPVPCIVLVVVGEHDQFAHPRTVRADVASSAVRDRATIVQVPGMAHEFSDAAAHLTLVHARTAEHP